MLRQLINVVRYVLQAIRKYIRPLILIVSFLTFVWLIVDTAHRPEFVRHASKHSFRRNQSSAEVDRWDETSVQRFLDLLDVQLNVSQAAAPHWPSAACQQDNAVLFTAFAGSSLREHLWHYFTLVALEQRALRTCADEYDVRLMLTVTARAELSQLFVSLPAKVIDERTIECYDVPAACILNDDTPLELPQSGSQLYIVNNNVMRLRDILDVSWDELAEYFEIDPKVQKIANDILAQLRWRTKQHAGEEAAAGAQFVGVSVNDQDRLPIEYYFRAITFQRKMYDTGTLVFVVLCENLNGSICSMLNVRGENLTVFQQNVNPAVDFALMALCNHTIVSHESDVFPALLRGTGNTVVHGYQDDYSRNVGLELANYRDHWYTIV